MATELDLTPLEEPPYSDLCWKEDKGCKYPVSKVRIVVHPSLIERAPGVVEFLRKWDLDTATQVAVETKYEETDSYDLTVEWFMRNHEIIWTRWVTDQVRFRLKNVLDPRNSLSPGFNFPSRR